MKAFIFVFLSLHYVSSINIGENFLVMILNEYSVATKCNGVLISTDTILTYAGCVDRHHPLHVVIGGEKILEEDAKRNQIEVPIQNIYILSESIAVIKLPNCTTLLSTPQRLRRRHETFVRWAEIRKGYELKEERVRILTKEECQRRGVTLNETQMCALRYGSKKRQLDYGGPVFSESRHRNGKTILGISAALTWDNKIYTFIKIEPFLDTIHEIMRGDNNYIGDKILTPTIY